MLTEISRSLVARPTGHGAWALRPGTVRPMPPPLSPEWFDAAFERVRSVRLPTDRSARLQFVTPTARWSLVVDAGEVRRWGLGDVGDPDVEVRWDDGTAAAILRRELRGNDALLATTVVASDAGGTYIGPPAPLNLSGRPETAALPTFPDATFSAQFTYRDGPFGAVEYLLGFEDGRLADERLTGRDDADASIECGYLMMAQTRAGEATILEALEQGSVRGDIGALAALAGIFESPEFHAIEVASGRHAFALGVLGLLDADPAYADALVELRSGPEV